MRTPPHHAGSELQHVRAVELLFVRLRVAHQQARHGPQQRVQPLVRLALLQPALLFASRCVRQARAALRRRTRLRRAAPVATARHGHLQRRRRGLAVGGGARGACSCARRSSRQKTTGGSAVATGASRRRRRACMGQPEGVRLRMSSSRSTAAGSAGGGAAPAISFSQRLRLTRACSDEKQQRTRRLRAWRRGGCAAGALAATCCASRALVLWRAARAGPTRRGGWRSPRRGEPRQRTSRSPFLPRLRR
jgi:hypothetical protein